VDACVDTTGWVTSWVTSRRRPAISGTGEDTFSYTIKDKDGNVVTHDAFGATPEEANAKYKADKEKYGSSKSELGVPDAPFKSADVHGWPGLALKRMIRHAAENGYDRISWTPGEVQSARYDLSKQLSKVIYEPDKQHLVAFDKNNQPHINEIVEPKQLPDYIGKDLADKLLATSRSKETVQDRRYKDNSGNYHKVEGVDLKVGGEGMREFYDKMLPRIAEKIGKAHGVKVKTAEINHQGGWDDDVGSNVALSKHPVHYFDLPQSLKDQALHKGFPLYMAGVPFPLQPVDYDPFKRRR